jgi:transcriptional regulator with XRE-family HTH domain
MSDLAQRIRAARDKLGVSIEEAERGTKIRRRYIEAIEAGDFARLPDGPPSRGFIKNYARYLGLDPDQSLTDFEAEVGVPITQVSEVVPPPPTRQQAVSRYTQLIKLPQVRWKGDLPPDEQAELDQMADAEENRQAGDESAAVTSLGRLVFRRTATPALPNSFSLREPKVTQAGDVRPFQTGSSPFSLRNLTGSLSNQATAQPRHISPMSVNGPDGSRLLVVGAAAGALVLIVALISFVILPALRGNSAQAALTPTQGITIAFLGGTPQPAAGAALGVTSTGALTQAAVAPSVQSTVPLTDTGATSETTPATSSETTPQPVVQPIPGGGVQLTLDAHEHAWVRVSADGAVIYEGIPPIGPNSSWRGKDTVGIETGNAGAFDILINNVRLGPAGARDVTLKVVWDAAGKVVGN